MPNNHEIETIKEQKKARRSYLELKKMQKGQIPPEPKPSEIALVPKTFSQKLKNFWYHDKKVVLVSLFFVIVMTLMTVQCARQPKYDLQVVLFTYNPVLNNYSDNMAEYFEKYCEDINGDGEVNVKVINCSFDAKDDTRSYRKSKITRLEQAIASEASAVLYITDPESLKHFDTFEKDFFNGKSVKLSEDFYKDTKMTDFPYFEHNLTIYCREIDGTMIESSKNSKLYYKQANKIITKLTESNN